VNLSFLLVQTYLAHRAASTPLLHYSIASGPGRICRTEVAQKPALFCGERPHNGLSLFPLTGYLLTKA
jgi:hypothetical protein